MRPQLASVIDSVDVEKRTITAALLSFHADQALPEEHDGPVRVK